MMMRLRLEETVATLKIAGLGVLIRGVELALALTPSSTANSHAAAGETTAADPAAFRGQH